MRLLLSLLIAFPCLAQEPAAKVEQRQAPDVSASIVGVHLKSEGRAERSQAGFVGPEGLVYTYGGTLHRVSGAEVSIKGERFVCTGVAGYEYMSEIAALRVEWVEKAPVALRWGESKPENAAWVATLGDEGVQHLPVGKAEYCMWAWLLYVGLPREDRIKGNQLGSPVVDAQGHVLGLITQPSGAPMSLEPAEGEATLAWFNAARAEMLGTLKDDEAVSWEEWPERYRAKTQAWTNARRAQSLGHASELDRCLEEAERAIETDPRCWGGWQWLATAKYHTEDLDGALKAVDTLLKLNPVDDWGLSIRAVILAFHELDLDAAEKAATLAVKRNPRDSMAWYALGYVMQYQQDYEEAVRSYEKALKLDPDNELAKTELERLKEWKQEFDIP